MAKFTKQHYQEIASVIKNLNASYMRGTIEYRGVRRGVLLEVINDLSVKFINDNPKFDRTKFIEACF